jgi:lipopolysaccharide biosynthesis glycosyltransferase
MEYDLKGKVLAATPNFGVPFQKEVATKLGFPIERPYFNAGIMVIDISRWKNEKIADRTIEFLQSNPEKLTYAEQCALNYVIAGDFAHLPPKWNLTRSPWEIKADQQILHIAFEEMDAARKNPSLIHFVGPSKPWHFANKNPWKKDYCAIRQRFHFSPYIADDLISGILALIRIKILKLIN